MGTWGPELFQDDDALDLRNEFIKLYNQGKSEREITTELKDNFLLQINDADIAPIFWLALASLQWEYGILTTDVKNMAMNVISSQINLKRWKDENPTLAWKREKVLNDLYGKLSSPLPVKKKITIKKAYINEWKINDVYAYKLVGELAKTNGIQDEYLLVQKAQDIFWIDDKCPVVRIKITKGGYLPKSQDEWDSMEYIIIRARRLKDFFIPPFLSECKKIYMLSTISNSADERGIINDYLMVLFFASKRQSDKLFHYIGNFTGFSLPLHEYIPEDPEDICQVHWKHFEFVVMRDFIAYNLRGSTIYK